MQAQQSADGIALNAMDQAKARVEANFEFLEKIGIPYYCFHDRDIAPEGNTLQETNKNLDVIVDLLEAKYENITEQSCYGIQLTCSQIRVSFMAQATTCNADVYAYAGAQLKEEPRSW